MQLHIKFLSTKLPFTQAVRCGHFVYVSGQASVDLNTGEIKCGTLAEEMTLSLKNLRAVIESARAIWAQIIKINCNLRIETDLAEYNQLYTKYFTDHFPSLTTITNCPLPQAFSKRIVLHTARPHANNA